MGPRRRGVPTIYFREALPRLRVGKIMDSKIIYLTTEDTESTEEKMRFGSKLKLVSSLYQLAISSVFSVSSLVNSSRLGKNLKVMSYE